MNKLKVSPDDIAEVISVWTGIPACNVNEEESKRLLELEKIMQKRVIGQNDAIKRIASSYNFV